NRGGGGGGRSGRGELGRRLFFDGHNHATDRADAGYAHGRRSTIMRPLTLLLLASVCGWAQIEAPFLGYFTDGGHVRTARGIAASSIVSEPLPGEFSRIAAASDFLIVAAMDTGEVSV